MFASVHLPPVVVLNTNIGTYECPLITNESNFGSLIGSTFAFVRPRSAYLDIIPLMAIKDVRGAAAGVCPSRRSPPL